MPGERRRFIRKQLAEFELIRKLTSNWRWRSGVVLGPGDDAAALQQSADTENLLLQTVDLLIEDIHFRKGWGTPFQLGWKALAINLSDIAAMGGRPLHLQLALAIPASWTEAEILEFNSGLRALADQFQLGLVGGDLSRSPGPLMICISANGEVSSAEILRRSGAGPGDIIWVSGTLGQAAAALRLLKERRKAEIPQDFLDAFLQPQPEVKLGLLCASSQMVNALIDLSDGLAGDLGHILEASDVGAELEEEQLPIADILRSTAAEQNWDLLELVLRGGEDYRLLGCTPGRKFEDFRRLVEERLGRIITPVGCISEQKGLRLRRRNHHTVEIAAQAFDHFA